MKTLNTLILLLSLFFASGCAVLIKMPGNRLDSPETVGARRLKLGVSYIGTNDVVLTQDFMLTQPNPAAPTMDSGSIFYVGVGYGIIDWLDFEFRTNSLFQLKAQIIGRPRSQAEAGNFALALTAAGGFQRSNQSGSAISGLASSGVNRLSETTEDFALIAGFRVAKEAMFYGGPFVTFVQASGTSEYSSPNSAFSYSGSATSVGGNFGLELGVPDFQARIEGGVANVKMGSLNKTEIQVGFELATNIELFKQ